jgi:pimeloyl-ACP methyl ester carboxylesterase
MSSFASLVTVTKHQIPAGPGSVDIAVHSAKSNGEDKPTIVFIHGNSSSAKIWLDQFADAALTTAYNLVALDLAGHGESGDLAKDGTSEAGYTLSGFASTVAKVIDAAGLNNKDTILIGWSLGGHIAIRTIPLLNLGGYGAHGTPPLSLPIDMSEGFSMGDPSMAILFKPEPYTLDEAKLRVEGMLAPGYSPLPEVMIQDVLRRDPEFSRVLPTSIMSSDVNELDILRKMDRPFLLGHGKDERVIRGDYLDNLAASGELKTLWEGKVTVFEKAGHTPQLENPKAFNAAIAGFAKHCFGR